ncbi:uncharacterized protein EI90DRAFT_3076888 [Cantharellus anzutake]|uniref:uncharacterized protein n=1 Tax=Cantharellus anzutake TaxID=1750568 RepID=UPI00190444BF|nr:uncharacterized protein EI90DRAFT_3076888 [Cantharellus anzutake]KAF8323510.1 hypothetical protein EI90DRAFT_3076888 [Cantharellus anzutake]
MQSQLASRLKPAPRTYAVRRRAKRTLLDDLPFDRPASLLRVPSDQGTRGLSGETRRNDALTDSLPTQRGSLRSQCASPEIINPSGFASHSSSAQSSSETLIQNHSPQPLSPRLASPFRAIKETRTPSGRLPTPSLGAFRVECRHSSAGILQKRRLRALPQRRQTSSTTEGTSSRRRSKSWLKVPRSSSILRSIALNSSATRSKSNTAAEVSDEQEGTSLPSFSFDAPQAFSTPRNKSSASVHLNYFYRRFDQNFTVKPCSPTHAMYEYSPPTTMNPADLFGPIIPRPPRFSGAVPKNSRSKTKRICHYKLDFLPSQSADVVTGHSLARDTMAATAFPPMTDEKMGHADCYENNVHQADEIPPTISAEVDKEVIAYPYASHDTNLLNMFSAFDLDSGTTDYIVTSPKVESLDRHDACKPHKPTPSGALSGDGAANQHCHLSNEHCRLLQSPPEHTGSQSKVILDSFQESQGITPHRPSPCTPPNCKESNPDDGGIIAILLSPRRRAGVQLLDGTAKRVTTGRRRKIILNAKEVSDLGGRGRGCWRKGSRTNCSLYQVNRKDPHLTMRILAIL